jgi:hypothetical protein
MNSNSRVVSDKGDVARLVLMPWSLTQDGTHGYLRISDFVFLHPTQEAPK